MAQDRVIAWMREQAPWYATHSVWPVTDMGQDANELFDRQKWEALGRGQYAHEWGLFIENKRYEQAERVFKSLKLPMHKDAEE